MAKLKSFTSNRLAQIWIILGIPILFIIGSLMHFAYDWSGNLIIVGLFSPVNESVWEHLKLAFWPILFWWFAIYFLLRKNNNLSTSKWFVSCAVSESVCLLTIMSFYYTYTGALGIESLILDIFSLFLGITLGQITALHIFKYTKTNKISFVFAFIILILMAIAFIVFTFIPPRIPLFQDPITGQYGIYYSWLLY